MTTPTLFVLAADNPSQLLELLYCSPSLANSQDEYGYSLLHAAASYSHYELLRSLVTEYQVDVNLKDKDGDTALFFVETLECARILLDELKADITIRGSEGKTAAEKILEDGDFPEVAQYLRKKELEIIPSEIKSTLVSSGGHLPPPLPNGMSLNIDLVASDNAGEVADEEFRRRIEDLAARDDFSSETGQEILRKLVADTLRSENV